MRSDKPITGLTVTVTRDDGVVAIDGTALCYTFPSLPRSLARRGSSLSRSVDAGAVAGARGELDVLAAALDGAAAGQGSVVLIFGEPGIGKTSLVRTFVRQISGRARVLQGACDDLTPRARSARCGTRRGPGTARWRPRWPAPTATTC